MRRVRIALALAGLLGVMAQGQIPGPMWYRSATGMLGRPAANADAHELERMERYLVFGSAYCGGLAASAYAANLAVARNMTSYLAQVGATATDPQSRILAQRLIAGYSSFPCAYPGRQLPAPPPPPPPKAGDAPFIGIAPDLGKVPDAEQETAADLVVRYDTDVARSAAAWKNAEQLRLNLVQRGMTLNAQTQSSVLRLGPLYSDAAEALKAHNWEEALSNLKAAEATTQKVEATVGH
jgi:hypothetical protein